MEVPASQQRLGRFVRRHPRLMIRLGNLESGTTGEDAVAKAVTAPIYVTGLARAGTTVLLEMLAAHPDLASHCYRDFPFVHTPLWWNRFQAMGGAGDGGEPVERAHKDRIAITRDSPEAMEEVLWMSFFPDCHDPKVSHVLDREDANPDFDKFYREHIGKILHLRGGTRYLAKGNYNVSRLQYLHRLFPDARFIVPYRDPAAHIASLMKQHKLFSRAETEDPRVLDYMKSAGHYEFGLNRVPVNLDNPDTTGRIMAHWDAGEEVAGWALYWAAVYGFIADQLDADAVLRGAVMLVPYDRLCAESDSVLGAIYRFCGMAVDEVTLAAQAQALSPPDYYTPGFDDAERHTIDEATRPTLKRLQMQVERTLTS